MASKNAERWKIVEQIEGANGMIRTGKAGICIALDILAGGRIEVGEWQCVNWPHDGYEYVVARRKKQEASE